MQEITVLEPVLSPVGPTRDEIAYYIADPVNRVKEELNLARSMDKLTDVFIALLEAKYDFTPILINPLRLRIHNESIGISKDLNVHLDLLLGYCNKYHINRSQIIYAYNALVKKTIRTVLGKIEQDMELTLLRSW
jgi:hypothetical protein